MCVYWRSCCFGGMWGSILGCEGFLKDARPPVADAAEVDEKTELSYEGADLQMSWLIAAHVERSSHGAT